MVGTKTASKRRYRRAPRVILLRSVACDYINGKWYTLLWFVNVPTCEHVLRLKLTIIDSISATRPSPRVHHVEPIRRVGMCQVSAGSGLRSREGKLDRALPVSVQSRCEPLRMFREKFPFRNASKSKRVHPFPKRFDDVSISLRYRKIDRQRTFCFVYPRRS